MILYIVIAILFVLLSAAVFCIFLLRLKLNDQEKKKTYIVPSDEIKLEVSTRDIIHLADASCIVGLNDLMEEYDIERKLPSFYQKYHSMIHGVKEKYFETLLSVLSRDSDSYYNRLLNTCLDVSTQDVLLLLLADSGLDNKTCARVLFINSETLRKRKTRLKMKIEQLDLQKNSV